MLVLGRLGVGVSGVVLELSGCFARLAPVYGMHFMRLEVGPRRVPPSGTSRELTVHRGVGDGVDTVEDDQALK